MTEQSKPRRLSHMDDGKRNDRAWPRFLGARAELIHDAVKDGRTAHEVADWLSMDPGQVQLISRTPLVSIVETDEWRAARAAPAQQEAQGKVERRHREAVCVAFNGDDGRTWDESRWLETGDPGGFLRHFERLAQALCDAEARGAERALRIRAKWDDRFADDLKALDESKRITAEDLATTITDCSSDLGEKPADPAQPEAGSLPECDVVLNAEEWAQLQELLARPPRVIPELARLLRQGRTQQACP